MSLYRLGFYYYYSPYSALPEPLISDFWDAMWLGMRLDLSVLGYVTLGAFLIVGILTLFRVREHRQRSFLLQYLFLAYLIIISLLGADAAFFSYFGEHANIMIFGVMDDDTLALLQIAWKNYNLPVLGLALFFSLFVLWKLLKYIFRADPSENIIPSSLLKRGLVLVLMIALSFLAARGSLGHFPISKYISDVSSDPFINQLPQNGVFAMTKAYRQYKKSKSDDYDLIKMMGYEENITEAFRIHLHPKPVNPQDLTASLHRQTPINLQLEKNPPNVVVIMVESFGMPITAYQSSTFDIMGRLKKHFDEDTVFKNFVSGSNGTIVSMEPFLLNIAARPESTAFGQSLYMKTAFQNAAARVYQTKGYETSFVYGGDLSWRNVGNFMKLQGFDRVEGKGGILNALHLDEKKSCHSWGVFDQYAYDFLLHKLQNGTKPQFIYLMTTNNHPPYEIPSDYRSRPLQWSNELTKHMKGDRALLEKRLHDYGYALDMAGRFMDEIKKDPRYANTVVVITADNNTIESQMLYDDPITTSKRIPFYLYLPSPLKPKAIDTTVPGSHKDVFATLYPLTLSNADYLSFGNDLMDPNARHCGFNDAGVIVSKQGTFMMDKPKNPEQSLCNEYYKATLAAEEYLIRSQLKAK